MRIVISSSFILFVWYIYYWWPLGLQFISFHNFVQFGVAHNDSVVTSNVELVVDCYICDEAWSVCYDIFNFGRPYTVWAFPRPW